MSTVVRAGAKQLDLARLSRPSDEAGARRRGHLGGQGAGRLGGAIAGARACDLLVPRPRRLEERAVRRHEAGRGGALGGAARGGRARLGPQGPRQERVPREADRQVVGPAQLAGLRQLAEHVVQQRAVQRPRVPRRREAGLGGGGGQPRRRLPTQRRGLGLAPRRGPEAQRRRAALRGCGAASAFGLCAAAAARLGQRQLRHGLSSAAVAEGGHACRY